ncbi:zinc finger Y-chromosomal protein-like [Amphiura filiformis]|uniref:zinc finger Y-chromosomal protein-like n=1 Tax=Amphiura filiformis TaxID=82378 RepID=UPI003B2223E8
MIKGKTERKTENKTVAINKSAGYFACRVPLCTYNFSYRKVLMSHLKKNHDYDIEKATNTVQEWYNNHPASTRKLNVNTMPFVCTLCHNVGFPSRAWLHTHLCSMHQFTEEQSDIKIAKEYGVIKGKHLPDSLFYTSPIDVKSDGTDTTCEDDSVDPKPACPKCGQEFEHVSQARWHFESDCTSNPLQCKLCGTNLRTTKGYKRHMDTHENQQKGLQFPCQTCKKVFYNKHGLTQHETSHKPSFICDFCGEAFPIKTTLEFHLNSKHTKETKYACQECPKWYYTKKTLANHVHTVHGELGKLIPCHICGKMIIKGHLNGHVRNTHTQEDGVRCLICNKEFKRKLYLEDHMKEVHGNGGAQYRCTWPNCNKEFTRKRTLKSHVDTHSGNNKRFACSMCDKRFRDKNHLHVHMNWHKGIRPYQCSHCEKRFLTNWNLKKHLVTHSRQRPDLQ